MTTAPAIDERLHRDALAPLVDAELAPWKVYDHDDVPKPFPAIFALLAIERTYVQPRKAGLASRSGWRVEFQYVGRSVDEARHAALKVAAAVEGKRITVGGVESTPVTHESTEAIKPDDGRFSGRQLYTYTL